VIILLNAFRFWNLRNGLKSLSLCACQLMVLKLKGVGTAVSVVMTRCSGRLGNRTDILVHTYVHSMVPHRVCVTKTVTCGTSDRYTTIHNIRDPWSVLLTHYFSGDKIEKNEMDGACNAYGGDERRIQGFGGETW